MKDKYNMTSSQGVELPMNPRVYDNTFRKLHGLAPVPRDETEDWNFKLEYFSV